MKLLKQYRLPKISHDKNLFLLSFKAIIQRTSKPFSGQFEAVTERADTLVWQQHQQTKNRIQHQSNAIEPVILAQKRHEPVSLVGNWKSALPLRKCRVLFFLPQNTTRTTPLTMLLL